MSFDRPSTAPGDASGDGVRPGSENDGTRLAGAESAPGDAAAQTADGEQRPEESGDADGHDELAGDDGSDDGVLYEDQVEPEYGIIGFTLRELIIVGAWLVGFLASFFPIGPIGETVWTSGIHWILMMGVPTAAVFLVVLRRLSPEGIRRVGSLGIDQFASVAASVAAVAWAQVLWQQVAATIATGAFLIGWPAIVGLLAMLVLVAVTVFGPLLPRLREDFRGRLETLAHRNANPVRPVVARPRPEREAAPSPAGAAGAPRAAADHEPTTEESAEPRVETALTVVIPDEQAATGAGSSPAVRDEWRSADRFAEPVLAEPAQAEPGAAAPLPIETDTGAPELSEAEPDDEVLYNTAAVNALRDIFDVDETTNPRRPVEHNTAPDGIAGSDVGRLGEPLDADAADTAAFDSQSEPMLRRSRGEQPSGDAEAEPERAEQPVVIEPGAPSFRQPEPFWILTPTERDVLDERGEPLFRVGPTAWALAIEDRGGAFVVRHEDGRIGYLHDISDITKG